jgi:hypothetical protein
MVLPGCGKSNSSSSGSAGQTTQITAPTGTVSGTVEDNNGNPISGASVYVAGQTPVTTNAGGQFSVPVVVTGATAGNGATATGSGTTPNQALTIQIVPPTGYLSALVTVTPAAQLTSSDNGTSATGETNPQEVFIDGFSASAGVVRLPKESTTIVGTILNAQTGNPIPTGTHVDLDFIGPNFDQTNTAVGTAVTYGSGATLTTATTSATGAFQFTNAPDDSCLRIDAPGFILALPAGSDVVPTCSTLAGTTATDLDGFTFSTIVESANSVTFSLINATPATAGDLVAPFVTSVASVVNEDPAPLTGAAIGQFDSTVTTTITVKFDEPVTYTASTAFPVTLFIGTTPNQTAVTPTSVVLGADKETLTITLPSALPQKGQSVLINLPVQAFADLAGNALSPGALVVPEPPTADTAATGQIPTRVTFDGTGTVTLTTNSVVVQLSLLEFQPLSTTAAAPTLAQVFTQVATKSTDAAYLTTSALVDVVDGTTAIMAADSAGGTVTTTANATASGNVLQLNSQAGNVSVPASATPSDAAFYLTGLVEALRGPANTDKAFTNLARVTVTIPVGATDVVLSLQRNNLTQDVLFFGLNDGQGAPVPEGPVTTGKAGSSGTTLGSEWYGFKAPAGATLPYTFDVAIYGDAGAVQQFGPPLSIGAPTLAAGQVSTGSVKPGDTVYAVSRGSSGLVGSSATLVLADQVPPTTALQLFAQVIAATGNATTGAGGGVLSLTGGLGQVIYPITPQAGDVSYVSGPYALDTFGTGEGPASNDFEVTDPSYAGGIDTTYLTTNDATYAATSVLADATSTLKYLNTVVSANPNYKLGVAVDEPVSLVTGAAPSYTGTNATLTGYAAGGSLNQATQKDPSKPNVNLVSFVPSSLLGLQADGRAKAVLSFTGAIQDQAATPNVATAAANATVQFRDFFPPLMVAGFFDGTNLVFDFDEPVQLKGQLIFAGHNTCGGATTIVSLVPPTTPLPTGVGAISLATGTYGANTRVIVPFSNFQNQLSTVSIGDCFTLPSYAEAEYSATGPLAAAITLPAAAIAPTPAHGGVLYVDVPDTANNSDLGFTAFNGANEWYGTPFGAATPGSWVSANLGLTIPFFATADLVGQFIVTAATEPPDCTPSFVVGSQTFDCRVRVSQPVYLGGLGANTGTDFDGDRADADNSGTVSVGTPTSELTAFCAQKFIAEDNTGAALAANPKPEGCTLLDINGAQLAPSSPSAYTAADIAKAYGFDVYFGVAPNPTTALALNYQMVLSQHVPAVHAGVGPNGTNSSSTISSAFSIGAYSVSNYSAGYTGATGGLTANGVIVKFNGIPPTGPFELTPAIVQH